MRHSKKVAGDDSKTSQKGGALEAQERDGWFGPIVSLIIAAVLALACAALLGLFHMRDGYGRRGVLKEPSKPVEKPENSEDPENPMDDPNPCSRFRGQTVRRKKDEWIKVEEDGVTFVCPTYVGEGVRPRKYTMPNPKQIAFMDELIAAYKTPPGWYKPMVNKSEWQPKLFNRGAAKQFLDDKHIACWMKGQKGGQRGCIRLSVPGERI